MYIYTCTYIHVHIYIYIYYVTRQGHHSGDDLRLCVCVYVCVCVCVCVIPRRGRVREAPQLGSLLELHHYLFQVHLYRLLYKIHLHTREKNYKKKIKNLTLCKNSTCTRPCSKRSHTVDFFLTVKFDFFPHPKEVTVSISLFPFTTPCIALFSHLLQRQFQFFYFVTHLL